jgi:hypothetical protein
MTLLAELEEFVRGHRRHGTMTGDATAPAWNGYRITVACACGVVFERWESLFHHCSERDERIERRVRGQLQRAPVSGHSQAVTRRT